MRNLHMPRAFRREGRFKRVLPFAVPFVAGIAVLVRWPGIEQNPVALWAAGLLATLLVGTALFFPWDRFPEFYEALPPFAAITIVFLLGAGTGQPARMYSPLLLLPLFWLALHGTRVQLLVGYLVSASALAASQFLSGMPDPNELRYLALGFLTTPVVCLTAQSLVREVHQKSALLSSLANTDALTGVPNRRGWEETLQREMARARRYKTPLCIAIMDMDHFKNFNDSRGHVAGDDLLRTAATDWAQGMRASDLLARIGGEEFAVLLPDCTLKAAVHIVERMRDHTPGGQTCSAGVARWDEHESAASLYERADGALYIAKLRGRNRTEAAERRLPLRRVAAEA